MVLLDDPRQTETILLLLSKQLDRYGLRINQKKVVLWEACELLKNRHRDIHSIFAEKNASKNSTLVQKFVTDYLLLSSDELEKSWNRGLPLLNRLLFAKLESLPSDLFEKIMQRYMTDKFLLMADQNKLARLHELNKLRTVPSDFPKILEKLMDESVHNSFHYEVQAFAVGASDLQLGRFSQERIKKIDEMYWNLSQTSPAETSETLSA